MRSGPVVKVLAGSIFFDDDVPSVVMGIEVPKNNVVSTAREEERVESLSPAIRGSDWRNIGIPDGEGRGTNWEDFDVGDLGGRIIRSKRLRGCL